MYIYKGYPSLCGLDLLSHRNRYDEKGHKLTNLYQINFSRLYELTCLPDNVVMMTPPPSHDDRRGIVTVTDKPLQQTFNKTSKSEDFGDEEIGTNFDNRPISKERMKEICDELGYKFD